MMTILLSQGVSKKNLAFYVKKSLHNWNICYILSKELFTFQAVKRWLSKIILEKLE